MRYSSEEIDAKNKITSRNKDTSAFGYARYVVVKVKPVAIHSGIQIDFFVFAAQEKNS